MSPEDRDTADAGFATPVVLGLAMVLGAVALVLSALAAVTVARHRAAAAADLAALAAAGRALDGEQDACALARAVADEHRAVVLSCRLTGDVADVVVTVRPGGRLGELGAVQARARAGPG